MQSKSEILTEAFLLSVKKYKDAMRFSMHEKNLIRKILYGIHTFGFSYVQYHLARLKVPVLYGTTRVPLFFDTYLSLPRADIGSHALAVCGMIPHRSERVLTLWMIKNLKNSDVFYDVGAHLGFYTALAEHLIQSGEVHAFEANATLGRYLRHNFQHDTQVHVVCSGIASQTGVIDFYDATDVEDSSASSRFNILGTSSVPTSISAISLDEYVAAGNRAPTVIKLDIEGGEYDAILGAERLIEKHRPRIILEVWGGEMGRTYSDNAVQKLLKLGYVAHTFTGEGSLSQYPVDDPVGSIADDTKGARDNFIFIAT